MTEGQLGAWVEQTRAGLPRADHEDHAGALSGPDEDVFCPRRAVDEIPCLQAVLLAFDQKEALAREHEKVLLLVLPVVHAVRLAGLDNVEVDAVEREALVPLESTPVPKRLVALPARLSGVDDEPTLPLGNQPRVSLDELRFRHHLRASHQHITADPA